MDLIDQLRVFRAVATLAGFTAAADQLGRPKASVSAAVRALEEQLGTRLLQRTTRRVTVTADGAALLARADDLLVDVEELEAMFRPGDAPLTGRLRVDVPIGIGRRLLVPRLGEFLDAHPQLQFELGCSDRRVDLVREGFDCVLRVGRLADSSLVARPLGTLRVLTVASPAYLRRFGTPRTLEDLAGHRLVHYQQALGGRPDAFEYVDADGDARTLPMPAALTVDNSEAYRAACLAGLGLIQAPGPGLKALLERGELVEVLPGHRAAPMPVHLLVAHRRQLPRRVRVFMGWVAELLAPELDQAVT